MNTRPMPEDLAQHFRSFAAYLQSGETDHLSRVFPGADEISAAAVYRNGFLRGSIEALRNSYPVVEQLVGDEYFDLLAENYVTRYPPQQATLVNYGKSFPQFLEQQLEQHGLAYLPDFARLDQAWLRAYFAEDSTILSEDNIEQWQQAGNDIENLVATLPASAELLTLEHGIRTTWLTLKSNKTLAGNTRIDAREEHLLLWRDVEHQIRVRELNRAELAFLQTLGKNSTLAQAAVSALELDAGFPIIEFFSELLETDVLAVNV